MISVEHGPTGAKMGTLVGTLAPWLRTKYADIEILRCLYKSLLYSHLPRPRGTPFTSFLGLLIRGSRVRAPDDPPSKSKQTSDLENQGGSRAALFRALVTLLVTVARHLVTIEALSVPTAAGLEVGEGRTRSASPWPISPRPTARSTRTRDLVCLASERPSS